MNPRPRRAGRTISEKILSDKCRSKVRAGDIVVCPVDVALGTDASTPMALRYFEEMGGEKVLRPDRIRFFRDHYAPPASLGRARHHDQMVRFARDEGIAVHQVGDGISHQVAVEEGLALPGTLVVGADSHTVMCGAMNCFATGIGSSDLAAVMITGDVWLRVPASIKVEFRGVMSAGVEPKDVVLCLLKLVGEHGANYCTLEFHGAGVATLDMEARLVLSNMSVELGAKAGIFPTDDVTTEFLRNRAESPWVGVAADSDANYEKELSLDLDDVSPHISLPHRPGNVVEIAEVEGTRIDMVFVGTCTGGRASDIRQTCEVVERAGGIAPGVQLVVTPASRSVQLAVMRDGTLARLVELGATVTTPGCGPCCGTSGPIPGEGMNVMAAQNRNFKARMGSPDARIFLGSPATCGAAAATGEIVDPRRFLV